MPGIVPRMLLVYGPRSTTYDFGPGHPLTPRRFGPSIDLLRAVGAEPGLAPEPAPDDELAWCHDPRYIEVVRRFSAPPFGGPLAGIGEGGDDPPFAGMHDAAAAVAGGSIRAMEAVLRGDHEHAFHPGGGLHHAMPESASGFCIYDDPALAIARARRDGLRVLYIDLDVHHGDGVQAIFWDDPGVLTVSIHESGRYLFPGSGFVDELGEGPAAGTAVNVPLEPMTGEGAWLEAVRTLLPELAAAFGPDIVVSQHGADSHAWDPLAHLRVTTTAMGEAARLVDAIAHRHAGGRWLATGGGGYDAYRVVPRMWSLVWLAGAHREVPSATPTEWRERWTSEGARYGQAPLPETFTDAPNAGVELDSAQKAAEARSRETVSFVRGLVVPRLLREARDRGWWDPGATIRGGAGPSRDGDRRTRRARPRPRGPRPPPPRDGATVSVALGDATRVVGLAALARPVDGGAGHELLAVGVAPAFRRRGLATALLTSLTSTTDSAGVELQTEVTLAERDPSTPSIAPSAPRSLAASWSGPASPGRAGRPGPRVADRGDPAAIRAIHPG